MADPGVLSTDPDFTALLADELAREERRGDSLDVRCVAVVSGSAAVLAFGAAAVALRRPSPAVAGPLALPPWVFVAVLLAAVAVAVFASLPRHRRVADLDRLLVVLRRRGRHEPAVVRRFCTYERAQMLSSLRKRNDLKAVLLLGAQGLQVLGVLTLLLAV